MARSAFGVTASANEASADGREDRAEEGRREHLEAGVRQGTAPLHVLPMVERSDRPENRRQEDRPDAAEVDSSLGPRPDEKDDAREAEAGPRPSAAAERLGPRRQDAEPGGRQRGEDGRDARADARLRPDDEGVADTQEEDADERQVRQLLPRRPGLSKQAPDPQGQDRSEAEADGDHPVGRKRLERHGDGEVGAPPDDRADRVGDPGQDVRARGGSRQGRRPTPPAPPRPAPRRGTRGGAP